MLTSMGLGHEQVMLSDIILTQHQCGKLEHDTLKVHMSIAAKEKTHRKPPGQWSA